MFVFSGSSSMDGVKGISCGKSRLLLFGQFNPLKKLFALLKKNNISCTSRRLAQSEDIRSIEAPDSCFLFTSSYSSNRIIANVRFMRIRRDKSYSLLFRAQLLCSKVRKLQYMLNVRFWPYLLSPPVSLSYT